jgi:hypothetical protein
MGAELAVTKEAQVALSPQEALMQAFAMNPTAEMAKQIVELQQSTERFQWEREERQAKIDFDDALNRCQAAVGRVAADAEGEKNNKYATYTQLDRALRPVYTKEGFSLSYSDGECPTPGKTRIVAFLRRGGVTREYFKDMTASTKGPKGNDLYTPIQSEAVLDSFCRRYLLKEIFNIAIGEGDTDGSAKMGDEQFLQYRDAIDGANNEAALKAAWIAGRDAAFALKDKGSMADLERAKNAAKERLGI